MQISNSIMELLRMELNRDAYEDWELRRAAVYALNDVDGANGWLDKVRKDPDWRVRYAAVRCFDGRTLPHNWIVEALVDNIPNIRCAAVEYMRTIDNVPLEMIETAINDICWLVREAAIYLCKDNRIKIPHKWITQLMNDEEEYIRTLARKELVQNGDTEI